MRYLLLLIAGFAPFNPPAGWTYVRNSRVTQASVQSRNQLDMGYPHGVGASATLTLRRREGETYIFVTVSKGYLNRSYQNGTARVRFDGQAERNYLLTAAANGRANIAFLNVDRTFIPTLKRARQLTVTLEFSGQPKRQLVFPTAGLRWDG